MIWLVLVAAVFVGGGAWFVATSMRTRAVVLVAGLAAVGAYWFIGKPDMGDEPLEARIGEIETLAQNNPESMRIDQVIALAQKRAHDNPDDFRPHWIMGKMLESSNNPGAAMLAYESALRRDPDNVEVLTDLADLRFKSQGRSILLRPSFTRTPSGQARQFRVGYLAGIGLWLQGKKAEAETLWADIDARASENGPERQMFAALRQMFGIDPPSPDPAAPPAIPPNK